MEKIRIAQIGINEYSHGRDIFNTLKKMSDTFEIVGYALVEDEKEKFSHLLSVFDGYKELSLDEILNDPTIDAVTVETEEIHLTKYAQMVAENGKHIHMEKPGGIDVVAFEDMINSVRKNQRILNIGYMYRYNPAVQDLLKRVKRGDLGEIICVEANMDCRHSPNVRDWLKTFSGGMTFFLGCHFIDLIMQIQGQPKRILPLNKCSGIDGVNGEDFGLALLEYPCGYSIVKTCALEYGGYMRRQLVVTGTKGTAELKPIEGLTAQGYYTDIRYTFQTQDWYADGIRDRISPFDRYIPMMQAFARMVRGEECSRDLDYEVALYKTILMCCEKRI